MIQRKRSRQREQMEIKGIEKQGDIVTLKMTMPECCGDCIYIASAYGETVLNEFEYCQLAYIYNNEKKRPNEFVTDSDFNYPLELPEFCPLRCNNG